MTVRLVGPTCGNVVAHPTTGELKACLRPATELGGLCSQCWRGLLPEERAALTWEAANTAQPTEDLTDALNALLALDASDYPESEAA